MTNLRNQPPIIKMVGSALGIFGLILMLTSSPPPFVASAKRSSARRKNRRMSTMALRLQSSKAPSLDQFPKAILLVPRKSSTENSLPQQIGLIVKAITKESRNSMAHSEVAKKRNDDGKSGRALLAESDEQNQGNRTQNSNSSHHRFGLSSYCLVGLLVVLTMIHKKIQKRGGVGDDVVEQVLYTLLQRKRLENELAYDIAYTSDVSEVGYGSVVSSWSDLEWAASDDATDTFEV